MNEETETMTPLESRELRGLSFKSMWGFFSTAVVILLGVWRLLAGQTEAITNELKAMNERVLRLEVAKPGDDKLIDLRMKTVEITISALQTQVADIRNQVASNAQRIQQKK